MKPVRAAILFAAAVMLSGGSAFAAMPNIEATPVPMAQKPNFSKMAFMGGPWTCSVMSSRRPGPYTTTSTTATSTDGYWMSTQTTTNTTSWIPRALTTVDRMTYDASTSRWIDMASDDQGGYDVSTSPGWIGNTIVWTDVTYPKTNATATNNPTTLTKVSDTRTTSVSTFKEPSGRLVTVKSSCTKSD
jgi:hypothetical protein